MIQQALELKPLVHNGQYYPSQNKYGPAPNKEPIPPSHWPAHGPWAQAMHPWAKGPTVCGPKHSSHGPMCPRAHGAVSPWALGPMGLGPNGLDPNGPGPQRARAQKGPGTLWALDRNWHRAAMGPGHKWAGPSVPGRAERKPKEKDVELPGSRNKGSMSHPPPSPSLQNA